jgi:hypothetical protein
MGPGSRFACPGRRGLIQFSKSQDANPHSRGAMRPSFARNALDRRGHRECRVRGAPAASRAKLSKAHERSHRGFTGATRHSLRNGFTAYFVLSPVTGLFCHRRLAENPAKLDASVGASGPHGFAVRVSALVSSAARVHRIPHPTFVTCATPLFRDGTAGHVHLIWVRQERKYFCEGGWTGFGDLPVGCKSVRRIVPVLCHTPRKRGIQYAETSRLITSVSGILDHPRSLSSGGASRRPGGG